MIDDAGAIRGAERSGQGSIQPGRVDRTTILRLVRYAGVSVVSTTTSLVMLGITVGVLGLPAMWSNVAATAVGSVPSFELNRRWVWSAQGRRSLVRQIVPFCLLSFTALAVSTLAVGLAASVTVGWSRWSHTLTIEAANVAAYGSLWVVQYWLLDRVLFRSRRSTSPGGAIRLPVFTGDEFAVEPTAHKGRASAGAALRVGNGARGPGA
jgi:putative flippase GtrA